MQSDLKYDIVKLLIHLNLSMAKNTKSGNAAKIIGVLTFISALAAELMPLVQKENPKLKKKVSHIVSLLTELKDEVMDVATALKKATR